MKYSSHPLYLKARLHQDGLEEKTSCVEMKTDIKTEIKDEVEMKEIKSEMVDSHIHVKEEDDTYPGRKPKKLKKKKRKRF